MGGLNGATKPPGPCQGPLLLRVLRATRLRPPAARATGPGHERGGLSTLCPVTDPSLDHQAAETEQWNRRMIVTFLCNRNVA